MFWVFLALSVVIYNLFNTYNKGPRPIQSTVFFGHVWSFISNYKFCIQSYNCHAGHTLGNCNKKKNQTILNQLSITKTNTGTLSIVLISFQFLYKAMVGADGSSLNCHTIIQCWQHTKHNGTGLPSFSFPFAKKHKCRNC